MIDTLHPIMAPPRHISSEALIAALLELGWYTQNDVVEQKFNLVGKQLRLGRYNCKAIIDPEIVVTYFGNPHQPGLPFKPRALLSCVLLPSTVWGTHEICWSVVVPPEIPDDILPDYLAAVFTTIPETCYGDSFRIERNDKPAIGASQTMAETGGGESK